MQVRVLLDGLIMNHGHSKTVCAVCNIVMTQCRCMAKDKIVKYDVCGSCVQEFVNQTVKQKKNRSVLTHIIEDSEIPEQLQ